MKERTKDVIILIVNDIILLSIIFLMGLSFFIMNHLANNEFSPEAINELLSKIIDWIEELM